MSKKVVKKASAKKVVKSAKAAPKATKKAAGKTSKNAKSSAKPAKVVKSAKKTAAKKAVKKIVSKKPIIKKSAATSKSGKGSKKKPVAVKKTLKKGLPAKTVKKAIKGIKKVLKKSIPKAKTPVKKAAPKKEVKKLVKPLGLVKSDKSKTVDKPVKKEDKKDLKKNNKAEVKETKDKDKKPLKAEKSTIPAPIKTEKAKAPRRSKKKKKDDDDEPAIENDPLIEEIIRSTKKRQTQPKKPKIIQTFVNPMASLAVAPTETGKKSSQPKKEPKGKFELEYVVRTSAGILFEFLTSPSGLSEWFADDVNIRDGVFTFFWDGSEQKARLLSFKEDKYVRLQWVDKPEGAYFEFKIEKDELTGDISLIITDFADEGSDLETSKRLWDSQVNKLLHTIGSY